MDIRDFIFTIIGITLGVGGTLLSVKFEWISFKNKRKQKNVFGNNVIQYGFTAEEVSVITSNINKLKDDQLRIVADELKVEIENRPQFFVGKDEPENAKHGDVWLEADEK